MLETHGIITKGQFDRAERLISECRKAALLPLDICASDEKRAPENEQDLDAETPKKYAEIYAQIAAESWESYTPISFWDYQPYYIEMAVEKIDLKELFKKVCAEYHVIIWNAGGWSDLNSRADTLKRFR
jgi:hypothetical protein